MLQDVHGVPAVSGAGDAEVGVPVASDGEAAVEVVEYLSPGHRIAPRTIGVM